jgi:hypothetical protein
VSATTSVRDLVSFLTARFTVSRGEGTSPRGCAPVCRSPTSNFSTPDFFFLLASLCPRAQVDGRDTAQLSAVGGAIPVAIAAVEAVRRRVGLHQITSLTTAVLDPTSSTSSSSSSPAPRSAPAVLPKLDIVLSTLQLDASDPGYQAPVAASELVGPDAGSAVFWRRRGGAGGEVGSPGPGLRASAARPPRTPASPLAINTTLLSASSSACSTATKSTSSACASPSSAATLVGEAAVVASGSGSGSAGGGRRQRRGPHARAQRREGIWQPQHVQEGLQPPQDVQQLFLAFQLTIAAAAAAAAMAGIAAPAVPHRQHRHQLHPSRSARKTGRGQASAASSGTGAGGGSPSSSSSSSSSSSLFTAGGKSGAGRGEDDPLPPASVGRRSISSPESLASDVAAEVPLLAIGAGSPEVGGGAGVVRPSPTAGGEERGWKAAGGKPAGPGNVVVALPVTESTGPR